MLKEVLAKYENKLGNLHRARLGDSATPMSPCLRAKKNPDEAGGSGKLFQINNIISLYFRLAKFKALFCYYCFSTICDKFIINYEKEGFV